MFQPITVITITLHIKYVVIRLLTGQPAIRREYKSFITDKYIQPPPIVKYLMSPIQI